MYHKKIYMISSIVAICIWASVIGWCDSSHQDQSLKSVLDQHQQQITTWMNDLNLPDQTSGQTTWLINISGQLAGYHGQWQWHINTISNDPYRSGTWIGNVTLLDPRLSTPLRLNHSIRIIKSGDVSYMYPTYLTGTIDISSYFKNLTQTSQWRYYAASTKYDWFWYLQKLRQWLMIITDPQIWLLTSVQHHDDTSIYHIQLDPQKLKKLVSQSQKSLTRSQKVSQSYARDHVINHLSASGTISQKWQKSIIQIDGYYMTGYFFTINMWSKDIRILLHDKHTDQKRDIHCSQSLTCDMLLTQASLPLRQTQNR